MIVRDILAGGLLLSGTALGLTAVVGYLRLPDTYARMHAATKPATLGVALCLIAAALRVDDLSSASKLLVAAAFQLLATPVAGHLLARAAHATGTPQSDHTVVDELVGHGDG